MGEVGVLGDYELGKGYEWVRNGKMIGFETHSIYGKGYEWNNPFLVPGGSSHLV